MTKSNPLHIQETLQRENLLVRLTVKTVDSPMRHSRILAENRSALYGLTPGSREWRGLQPL